MKYKLYKNIVKEVASLDMSEGCFNSLIKMYSSISESALTSIYSQFHHNRVKKEYSMHNAKVLKYYQNYLTSVHNKDSTGFLYRQALEINYPATLLARLVLEQSLKDTSGLASIPKSKISNYIKHPEEITDKCLSKEIAFCCVNDHVYGPECEVLKREMGLRYEKIISDFLLEKNIPYYDEETLRKEGYDKTPDFKLVLPVSIDNQVINWIECKALFATEESHNNYLKNQFWSYVNRFGPGLVIYWFGFIDEMNVNSERGVHLADKLPENIVTMESLLDKFESNFHLKF